MDIPASGLQSITFDVQEGEFVLRGDPAVQTVSMRVSIDRTWIFRLGEEGILQRLIKITGEGTNQLKVVTDIPHSLSNWGRAQYPIDFEIVVPASLALDVIDTSGIIRISGMKAAVDIRDGSGSMSVSDVEGPVTITKDSGDIKVARITGNTRISSKSGQMKLRELAALEIDQSDGNLDIAQVGTSRVHNNSGNIRANGIGGPLTIDDESGEIHVTDAKDEVTIHDTSGQIRVLRAGNVNIQDTSGDITIEQVASLAVSQKESGQVKVADVSGSVEVPSGIGMKRR
jgi:DUF4097 and DUF4098 domain-containing protein YvlB